MLAYQTQLGLYREQSKRRVKYAVGMAIWLLILLYLGDLVTEWKMIDCSVSMANRNNATKIYQSFFIFQRPLTCFGEVCFHYSAELDSVCMNETYIYRCVHGWLRPKPLVKKPTLLAEHLSFAVLFCGFSLFFAHRVIVLQVPSVPMGLRT